MLELVLAGSAVVAAGAGVLTGVFIGRRTSRVKWPLVPFDASQAARATHDHSFVTMRGDGWWRCDCGELAPDEKQPRNRVVKRG